MTRAGEWADLVSGLLYLSEGDYLGAGLSLAATLPYLGSAPGAVKLARHADDLPGGMARECHGAFFGNFLVCGADSLGIRKQA